MAQVSGNKITVIQASKNLGTVINNQESGNKIDATLAYRKITDVKPTQVDGQVKMTNYMGINSEGMNIFETKKVNEEFYQVDEYTQQASILTEANKEIKKQEADKKKKNAPAKVEEAESDTPSVQALSLDEEPTTTTTKKSAKKSTAKTEITFQDEE